MCTNHVRLVVKERRLNLTLEQSRTRLLRVEAGIIAANCTGVKRYDEEIFTFFPLFSVENPSSLIYQGLGGFEETAILFP